MRKADDCAVNNPPLVYSTPKRRSIFLIAPFGLGRPFDRVTSIASRVRRPILLGRVFASVLRTHDLYRPLGTLACGLWRTPSLTEEVLLA